jgi:hypothetical protein
VQAAIADTFAKFSKDGDFANAYEELVLRGFSETDAINQVCCVLVTLLKGARSQRRARETKFFFFFFSL